MQKTAKRSWMPMPIAKHFYAGTLTKILCVMKLTVFLLTVVLLQVNATGRAQTVSISGKAMPLKQVLESVKKQSGYAVFGNADLINGAKPVTIDARDMALTGFLDMVFRDQQITYQIINKNIVLSRAAPQVTRMPEVVDADPVFLLKGRVQADDGKPLEGATVREPTSQRMTYTGKDGSFVLPVSPGSIIIVSFVGFASRELTIEQAMSTAAEGLLIKMQRSNVALADVTIISTGYQRLSKERATGSFSKPDMQVFKDRAGTMDITARLEGLVPGLAVTAGPLGTVNASRLAPGASQKALIRGTSSVSLNTNPLYVLNGMPVANISAISPDDIEDITVLKDAVASAIWGARAANGVIVINTKSGKKNQPMKVSYSGFVNFQGKPDFDYMPALSSRQYIETARSLFNASQWPYASLAYNLIAPHEQILYDQASGLISAEQANRRLDSLSAIDNKGQIRDLWYRPAITNNHTISVSGGSNRYTYYGSLSYTNVRDNRPENKNQQFRLNFNQDYTLNDALKVSVRTGITQLNARTANNIAVNNQFIPYQLFRNETGNGLNMNWLQGYSSALRADYQTRSRINLDFNPWNERNAASAVTNQLTVNVTGDVNLRIYKGLSFAGTYGYQTSPGSNRNMQDHEMYVVRKEIADFTVAPTAGSTPVYYIPATGSKLAISNFNQRAWTSRNQLVYSSTMRNGQDRLNVQVGQEAREDLLVQDANLLYGYDEETNQSIPLDNQLLANGIFNTVTSGRIQYNQQTTTVYEERARFESLFALLNYTFNNKYSLDASWRRDRSNMVGSDKSSQNKPIWSIGGKWDIGKEAFMANIQWLNSAALRATYGITGNAPAPGGATYYDLLRTDAGFGAPAGAGANVNIPANRKLNWESTKNYNLGADITMLDARVTVSMDLYWKKTSGLLGLAALDPLTGFRTTTNNLGEMKNRGVEVALQTVNIRRKDFEWTTSLNFSYNKNNLSAFTTALDYLSNSAADKAAYLQYYPLYAMMPVFGYRYGGLDASGDPLLLLENGTTTKTPTAATVNDVVYKGSQIPAYTGAFMNRFRYRSFSLNVNTVYNLGHVMRRDINTLYNGRITGTQASFVKGNLHPDFIKRWQQAGDEATTDIPRYIPGEVPFFSTRNIDYYLYADRNIVSASYIKVRDITLSYNLPQSWLQLAKLGGVSIYAQATNFMIWKANDLDIDPEYINLSTGERVMPSSRHSYTFGANVSF
jgi:TonB-linked SusC/RagA family outer membrane protein